MRLVPTVPHLVSSSYLKVPSVHAQDQMESCIRPLHVLQSDLFVLCNLSCIIHAVRGKAVTWHEGRNVAADRLCAFGSCQFRDPLRD